MIRNARQAGDTIVEVLIAMAVASLILGGAYTVTNRSLANARQAQEQTEALKLIQGQVERLKALYPTNKAVLQSGAQLCIKNNTVVPASNCMNEGSSVGYRLAIKYRTIEPATFVVTATWPSATGNGDSKVTQAYRVVK